MWRMAMTLVVEVMMITASTSMKLPNVSSLIKSENDRGGSEFGVVSAVTLVGAAGSVSGRNIRCISGWANMLRTPANRAKLARLRGPGIAPG